ncbi:hypothetical protein [Metapseudomonas otitidis]|uniref:hypothetical protein n=1 Tax=Metapseudomonas otitidis TaxID=319939 RepID=UPI0008EA6903|nr:hypothetical protein [Pseudomonas otitidis]SFA66518.1 hypothetical protein SAMN05216263_12212 [Pseudomonas otitidis]
MRIDTQLMQGAGASSTQKAGRGTAQGTGDFAGDYAAALAGEKAGQPPKADFSHMNRGELMEWINAQVKATGTLDGTESLVSMTLNGVSAVDGSADNSRSFDYLKLLRDGIDGAQQRNDMKEAERLRSTLDLLGRYQEDGASNSHWQA